MYVFDADSRSWPEAQGRRAQLSGRWNIGQVPNGGYVMAVAARALLEALERPDPLTVTGHYMNPAQPGPAQLEMDLAPAGRRLAAGSLRLRQEGLERARFMVTATDLGRHSGVDWSRATPPVVAAHAHCVPAGAQAPAPLAFHDVVDVRLDPASAGSGGGDPQAEAEVRGWLAFSDGRPPDALALLLFADAMPPPIFRVLGQRGWVPTVELTVHVRARPAPGPVAGVFRTRYVSAGVLEEDGELWDADGRLVALSRQLALLREPAPPK